MIQAVIEAPDRLPLAVLFGVTVLLLLGFHEMGFRFARGREAPGTGAATQAGAAVSGVLALLSLMLAFAFGMAGARFDARRQAVLDEANAIGTTWLRSRILPSPQSDAIDALLRHYVDVRVEAGRSVTFEELERAAAESVVLHERLWRHAVAAGRAQPASLPVGLFIESLNELIDLHEERMAFGIRHRLRGGVWFTLYFMAFASMMIVGAHARLTGARGLRIAVLLVIVLSAAMTMTIDLDRQRQTLFSVDQGVLMDLQEQMAGVSVE